MKFFKSKKIGLLVIAAFTAASFGVAAGGNGNGNEPPKKLRIGVSSFLCSVLPFMCSFPKVKVRGGNGNGNEPD